MPADLTVRGAENLAGIARALKEAGNGELRRELFKGLNRATKPLKADVKQSAIQLLPSRGGLNTIVANAKLTTSNRASGKNPGVRLTAKSQGHNLPPIDRGMVRHPVFGRRSVWVLQPVTPGFFTKPLNAGVGKVRLELLDVLDDIARKVTRP